MAISPCNRKKKNIDHFAKLRLFSLMARAAAILGAAAGVALLAGLHHSATEMPADKELGPWSSYFSYNSQVKLVRNPAYRTRIQIIFRVVF